MGLLTATSPATPPSLDQKVPFPLKPKTELFFFFVDHVQVCNCLLSGVNIGGAGSYVYDAPANEAPAAVSLETDAKPGLEVKKASARGPVKGEN